MNGRSSGESKKTIGFAEEVEVQSPEQPCSPATASMDFQEAEEWQVEKTSSVGCNQAHDTTFPRPSSNSPGQIDRSRALATSTREVNEMQDAIDQLQMASIRRKSLRVSAVINQLDLNLDEDNWKRGVSTGSVLLPTEDPARIFSRPIFQILQGCTLLRCWCWVLVVVVVVVVVVITAKDWVRTDRPSKDWVRGVSMGSKSASHSGSPTEERQKRRKEKKTTLFAHEGDENQAMKERARTLAAAREKSAAEGSFSAQLGSPITRFEALRYRMHRFLGSPPFEDEGVFVGCLVASNAVIIGMEVEHLAQHLTDLSPEWYQWVHMMYAVVFTVELLLRIGAYGVHIYSDVELFRWAALDFVIVEAQLPFVKGSVLVGGLDRPVVGDAGIRHDGACSSACGSSAANHAADPRHTFGEAHALAEGTPDASLLGVRAMADVTLKSLVWALVLLVLIMYVFAILLTQAATDRIREMQAAPDFEWTDSDVALKDFWGSLGDAGVYFMYIAFTIFAVLNVMTGVFCQSAIESAQRDHDMVMQNVVQEKEGHMSSSDPQVRLFFEALELSIDDVWTFFMLLDGDSGQEIDMEEFLFGCMRGFYDVLRGAVFDDATTDQRCQQAAAKKCPCLTASADAQGLGDERGGG
eukprot:s913_g12.t1